MRADLKVKSLEPIFWWSTLMLLTFQLRYYDLYLPKEEVLYRDTVYILGCGGFEVEGLECTDYLYGRFLTYFLEQLTFLHSHTHAVTITIISISLIPIAFMLGQFDKMYRKILGLALFLSPAIALLMQRANLDLLTFLLCWVAIKLFLRGNITISLMIVFLASSFKIYPVALLILLVALALAKDVSIKAKILWVLLIGSALCLAVVDMMTIPWLPSDARNSFGLRIFGEYFTYQFSGSGYQMLPLIAIFIGIAIFVFLILLIASPRFKSNFPQFEASLESTLWFIYFLVIFASGMSIDYRLLFLLPSLCLLTELNKAMRYVFTLLFLLSFYLSYPFEILQVFGDLALFLLLSFYILLLYRNRQQIMISIRSR